MLIYNLDPLKANSVIASLDWICDRGKAETGLHLKRVRSSLSCSLNINNEAFYVSYDLYSHIKNKISGIVR